jgi:hypothetical protein
VLSSLIFPANGPEGSRTLTEGILNPLPLPLGYGARKCPRKDSNLQHSGSEPDASARLGYEGKMSIAGFEPAPPCGDHHLKVARLPFRHMDSEVAPTGIEPVLPKEWDFESHASACFATEPRCKCGWQDSNLQTLPKKELGCPRWLS